VASWNAYTLAEQYCSTTARRRALALQLTSPHSPHRLAKLAWGYLASLIRTWHQEAGLCLLRNNHLITMASPRKERQTPSCFQTTFSLRLPGRPFWLALRSMKGTPARVAA